MMIGRSIPWVYFNGLGVIRDRLIILAFFKIGTSPNDLILSLPWVYFNGLTEVCDRSIILAFMAIEKSSAEVSQRILRVYLQSFIKI